MGAGRRRDPAEDQQDDRGENGHPHEGAAPNSLCAMRPITHPRLLSTRVAACVTVALLVFGAAACTDDASGGELLDRPRPRPAPSAGPPATPKPTLAAAVEALLGADQSGDHTGSYRLLTDASRKKVGDEADWADLRSELPPITGFEVVAGRRATTWWWPR